MRACVANERGGCGVATCFKEYLLANSFVLDLYVCECVCVCVCVYTYVCIYMRVYVSHTHTHANTRARARACAHTHLLIFVSLAAPGAVPSTRAETLNPKLNHNPKPYTLHLFCQ